MKGILIAIAAAAVMGVPAVTEIHRQPLQAAEIGSTAAEGVYMPEVTFNSSLVSAGVFPEPTPEPTSEPVYETSNDGWQYYGVCTVTHYCSCSKCCGQYASGYTASGTYATPNRTVAMSGLPFGTHVLVNGQEYIVEDRGVGGMWVDIFVGSHEEAYARGMFQAEVWIR